ncbi:uncharacterized protein [Palaemon carinicauda]|uniref:uncharacterized protein n=1 Tax=Palaemon carinicauda TaxID=392227 RepID=UPI0035B5DF2E
MYPVFILVTAVVLQSALGLPVDNDLSSRIIMPGDIPLMFGINSGSNGASRTSTSNHRRIIEPPIPKEQTSNETFVNGVKCGLKYGTAVYNGTCQRLLTQSQCSQGEWLVKKKDSNEGECVARNCPKGKLYFEKKCVALNDTSTCSAGQMLYVDLTGHVKCDCEPNYFYDPFQGKCFTQHERGTCNFGQYLEVTNTGRVVCVPNPCQMDGFLRNEVDGMCYRKQYKGICPHPFFQEDMTVHCIVKSPYTIFDLPTLRACPIGSLRDFSGGCREEYKVAAENVYPSAFGTCMNGFILDPMGNCRKANKLFR